MKRLIAAAVLAAVLCAGAWVALRFLIYPLSYESEIGQAAASYELEAGLVAALVRTESGFDAAAESPKGAVGLMQLLPTTAAWIADREGVATYELTVPADNLRLGCAYLRFLLDRYDGKEREALAAYNAGPGRVDAWLAEPEYAENGVLIEIPFAETARYCDRILSAKAHYARALSH